jgi:hypothetical protein
VRERSRRLVVGGEVEDRLGKLDQPVLDAVELAEQRAVRDAVEASAAPPACAAPGRDRPDAPEPPSRSKRRTCPAHKPRRCTYESMIEDAGLKIVGVKMKKMDADFTRRHYFDLEERSVKNRSTLDAGSAGSRACRGRDREEVS